MKESVTKWNALRDWLKGGSWMLPPVFFLHLKVPRKANEGRKNDSELFAEYDAVNLWPFTFSTIRTGRLITKHFGEKEIADKWVNDCKWEEHFSDNSDLGDFMLFFYSFSHKFIKINACKYVYSLLLLTWEFMLTGGNASTFSLYCYLF